MKPTMMKKCSTWDSGINRLYHSECFTLPCRSRGGYGKRRGVAISGGITEQGVRKVLQH